MKASIFTAIALIASASFARESKVICSSSINSSHTGDYVKASEDAVKDLNLKIASGNYAEVSAPSVTIANNGAAIVCVTVTQ